MKWMNLLTSSAKIKEKEVLCLMMIMLHRMPIVCLILIRKIVMSILGIALFLKCRLWRIIQYKTVSLIGNTKILLKPRLILLTMILPIQDPM
jgi:hypothetical protein